MPFDASRCSTRTVGSWSSRFTRPRDHVKESTPCALWREGTRVCWLRNARCACLRAHTPPRRPATASIATVCGWWNRLRSIKRACGRGILRTITTSTVACGYSPGVAKARMAEPGGQGLIHVFILPHAQACGREVQRGVQVLPARRALRGVDRRPGNLPRVADSRLRWQPRVRCAASAATRSLPGRNSRWHGKSRYRAQGKRDSPG